MKIVYFLAGLSLIVLVAACKVVESAGDVAPGRQALLEGKYQLALDYFWDAGNYAQARQTLEKDLSRHRSDNVARLYLGLTQYRLGDQQAALRNIQRGMKGIYDWLDYLNNNFRFEFGQFWDESGTVRAGIKTDLDMISSGKINWSQLIADGENLGIAIEQEEDDFRVQSLNP